MALYSGKGKCVLIGIGLVSAIAIVAFLIGFLTKSSSPEEAQTISPLWDFHSVPKTTGTANKHVDLVAPIQFRTGNAAESELCEYVPDEILALTRGVDITTLDILSTTVTGVISSPGSKRPVIKLTCKHKRLKKDSNGNVLVQLPDQVKPTGYQHISGKGIIHTNETSRHTEKSSFEVKHEMGAWVGIKILEFGMFSASASYKQKRRSLVTQHTTFAETKVAHPVIRIEFSPTVSSGILEPHDDFASEIEKLPYHFFQNPKGYLELVNQFGTHYFISGMFGGFILNSAEYAEGALDSQASSQVDAKAETEIKILGLKFGASYSNTKNMSQSKAAGKTSTKEVVYGGDVELGRSGKIDKWAESVENSPKLFSGQLKPISSLVEHEDKKRSLDVATKLHLGLAFVHDLDEILIEARQGTNLSEIYLTRNVLRSLDPGTLMKTEKLAALERHVTELINSDPIPLPSDRQLGFVSVKVFDAEIPNSFRFRGMEAASVDMIIVKVDKPRVPLYTRTTGNYPNIYNPKWNVEFGIVPVGMDGAIKFCVEGYEHKLLGRNRVDVLACSGLMTIQEIIKKKLNNVITRVTGFPTSPGPDGQRIILRVQISWHPEN